MPIQNNNIEQANDDELDNLLSNDWVEDEDVEEEIPVPPPTPALTSTEEPIQQGNGLTNQIFTVNFGTGGNISNGSTNITWINSSNFENLQVTLPSTGKSRRKSLDMKPFYDEIQNKEVELYTETHQVLIGKNKYGKTIYNLKEGRVPVIYNREDSYLLYIKSEELAKELGYVEDIYQGVWFKSGEKCKIRGISEHFVYKSSIHFFKEQTIENQKKFGTYSQTFQLSEGKQYTFGIEFEASTLWFPYYIAKDYNLDCMRDGSLNAGAGGPEIVTGVLHGDNGFRHLNEICNALSKRAKLDRFCSTHIHLGGMAFNKENLIYLYKLCCLIEDEVFQLVPESRRNNEYCRRLKNFNFKHDLNTQSKEDYKINIDSDYTLLYDFLAVKQVNIKSRKSNHPMGAKCGYNHSTPRYSWVNFVPAMFNTRGSEESKSWEIRLHSATLNYTKTKNWLLIWMGVMWFVENCKLDIKEGITLEDIMYKAYPRIGKILVQYIEDRKLTFSDNPSDSDEYVVTTDKDKTIKELCD